MIETRNRAPGMTGHASQSTAGASLTDWSMVLDSGRTDSPTRRDSLERLVRRYWPVLFAGARATGLSADEANDAVQGFIADILLERNLPGQATPDRGRFRGLLSRSLRNYLVDRARAATSRKRRPAGPVHSLQHEASVDPTARSDDDPELVFVRHWVATVLRTAIAEVRNAFLAADREIEWRILDARLIRPLVDGAEPVPYAALVEELGLRDLPQAASYLVNGKRALGRAIADEIGRTVADPADVEDEIRDLLALLATGASR